MKYLVIVPTYNERTNIELIIEKVLKTGGDFNILVIDDNSPDGTGEIVNNISKSNDRVKLIQREKKLGLGSAYIVGFKYALQNDYDAVFEMDADFSHNPDILPLFIKEIEKYDLVIGSRYLGGISVVHWPLRRLALSLMASLYVRLILNLQIKDCTAGFKCFRKEVLKKINLDKIKSDGYSFQIEMNYRAKREGFKISEIPIIFIDRTSGTSKMSRKIFWEALLIPWRLRLEYLFRKKL